MTTTPPPPPPFPVPALRAAPPAKAPNATLSMVLGIIGVAGFVVLLVPVFVAPVAWYLGAHARRDIEREPTRWSGAGEARTGMVLGMIGTGLMVIALALLLLVVTGLVIVSQYDAGYGS